MAKKGGGAQTVKTELDPVTREHMRRLYGDAAAAGSQPFTQYGGQTVAGVSPLSTEATERTRGMSDLGFGGMQGMAQIAMGNYGALAPVYQEAQNQAVQVGNEQATRAGAFGGSRHGVAQGVLQGQVANDQARLGASYLPMLANMGFGANQAQFGQGGFYRGVQQEALSDQERRFNEARDWQARNLGIMQGAQGPYGQTQTTPMNTNPFTSAAGGAATGAAIGGVPGAVVGGAGGLLGWW